MCDIEGMFYAMESDIHDFADQFLSDAAQFKLIKLCEAAYKSDGMEIFGSNPHLCASAIIYAFAQMNFLFEDEDGPMYVEKDLYFKMFDDYKQSTIIKKATQLKKILNYYPGHPDFCIAEVVEVTPDLSKLPAGTKIPFKFLTPDMAEQKLEKKAEAARLRAEKKKAARQEQLRKKREEERKIQPELFDFED